MTNDNLKMGGLEPIGEILPRVMASAAGESSSPAQTKNSPQTQVEDLTCKACGTKFQGEVTIYNNFIPPRRVETSECPACKAAREAADEKERQEELEQEREMVRVRWRGECGMPAELLTKTFDNFDKRYQRAAYKAALEWATDFDIDSPRGYRSLIFYSATPGIGKGHLMSGIVNHIIDNWQGTPTGARCPIRFESGPSLVRRIRATYNLRPKDDSHEREDEVYRALSGVPLLLLDDVGKEKPSDFTRETYWYIIDERVKSGLPVAVSSRRLLEGSNSLEVLMGVDTVDRLYGMTQGQIVRMSGPSYRRVKKTP